MIESITFKCDGCGTHASIKDGSTTRATVLLRRQGWTVRQKGWGAPGCHLCPGCAEADKEVRKRR